MTLRKRTSACSLKSKAVALPSRADAVNSSIKAFKTRTQLVILPLYAGIIGIVAIVVFAYVYYFAPISTPSSPNPTLPSTLGTGYDTQQQITQDQNRNTQAMTMFTFLIAPRSNCTVELVDRPSVAHFVEGISAWWRPTLCEDPLLQAIQIVRMSPVQKNDFARVSTLPEASIQLIDNIDTYALIYRQDNVPASYTLHRYLIPLTSAIFTDREYFNAATAQHQIIIDTYVYYLTGGCAPPLTHIPCTLWRWHRLTGLVELLNNYAGASAPGQPQQLGANARMTFAKTQEFSGGISLVRIDNITRTARVIYINCDLPEAPVQSFIELTPLDSLYPRYVP